MKTKKEIRKIFSEVCKICKRDIKGGSESAVKYNMRLHLEKHKKRGEK